MTCNKDDNQTICEIVEEKFEKEGVCGIQIKRIDEDEWIICGDFTDCFDNIDFKFPRDGAKPGTFELTLK